VFQRNILRAVTAATFLLLITNTAFGQRRDRDRGRWEYLGEANVDGAVDHDRIIVTGAAGAFRGIQLRVERGAIRFDRVIVHFEDGPGQPIFIRGRVPAGSSTRVIDLPGNRRLIRDVEFFYERASWRSNGRPKVRLFGIR
jgi:hypothetical protein